MTDGLVEALEGLLAAHDDQRSPLRSTLRPPAAASSLLAAFPDSDTTLHPDVVRLFAWHDGMDEAAWPRPGSRALLPHGVWFPPFDVAVAHQRAMLDGWSPEVATWSATWFPVLLAGQDCVAVDCAADAAEAGRVWYASLQVVDSWSVAPNLAVLFRAAARAFRERFFHLDGWYVESAMDDEDALDWLTERIGADGWGSGS